MDAWNSVLAQCKDRLERHQFIAAMGVKTADDFRQILSQLQTENQGKPQVVNLIRNLLPTLGHYELFAATFVNLMKNNVDISMMWGLLSIVIRVDLQTVPYLKSLADSWALSSASSPMVWETAWLNYSARSATNLST